MPLALLPDRYDRLLWAAVAILGALVVSRALNRLVGRLAARHPEEERELARLRRGETLLALLATAIPYLVAVVAIVAVVGLFVPDTAAALGGASLILILVGFGAQRFLMDVIAGALIAFERWYGVGDFVMLEPTKAAGVVEAFGLRTTVLRSLNGDRIYVPNSQIIGAVRSPSGYRRYSVELFTSDPEATREAIRDVARRAPVGEARFLRAPAVVEERDLGEGHWLVRARADVPPTMEWLAESLLVTSLKAQLEATLLADPIVYTLDEGALSRYERRVLVR